MCGAWELFGVRDNGGDSQTMGQRATFEGVMGDTGDHRREVREFLTSLRARLSPQQAGLAAFGHNRRVPGLRREEVATLAGVSIVYYTRLERRNLAGVSESVLDAVATTLQLDDAEREHLFDLARTANTTASARARSHGGAGRGRVPAGIQQVLDAITEAPADVRNGRRDILASNKLARALYCDIHAETVQPPNVARFTVLNPKARDFFVDWDRAAGDIVSSLRIEAGRHPYDKRLSDLVGELSTRSEEFRVRWASHNVRHHTAGTKKMHHPVVGEIELAYQSLALPGDIGLNLNVFTAAPGSPSQEALQFLANKSEPALDKENHHEQTNPRQPRPQGLAARSRLHGHESVVRSATATRGDDRVHPSRSGPGCHPVRHRRGLRTVPQRGTRG
jgi:transcriptional regulator with XRE-family HTH domain